jgi:uncharacterized protein (TIGR04255 family)
MPLDNETGLPIQRVWFINKQDDQLIQFQFDRFYFNWRRRQDDYPRYPYVIKKFENILNNAIIFFKEFDLGELEPIECELCYINHIPKGQGWNEISDLSKIFSDFNWDPKSNRFLANPESISWHSAFKLPGKYGSLAVNLKQALRTEDKIPLFVLELTARGIGESKRKDDILKWFDLAHEWIVKGFTDLTTPQIQRFWEHE